MAGDRPILIVDDDHMLRTILVEQLTLDGEFSTAEAASVRLGKRAEVRTHGNTSNAVETST